MVDADVLMSMGDIVMMKEEEGDSSNSHKTQVILHLQSISQGTNEDIADSGTAVLAVETSQENRKSDGEEIEYGYPITCGESKAVLLFKKFVCPGINVKCVKFNGQLISPKQFVHLAGKATLKDWKRAIRLGGVMLRKMMDSGQIDFYQHDVVCTNSCRSTKFDLLINNTRYPPNALQTPTSPLPGNLGQVTTVEEKTEDMVSVVLDSSPGQFIPAALATNGEIRRDSEDVTDETLSFWKGIAEMGLMGEVVSTIRTELLAMLRGVERRSDQATLLEADVAVLNSLTQMFGLLDSVRHVLELQRSKTDENQQQILNTLNVLESQLDRQKRQGRDWRPNPQPGASLRPKEGSSKPSLGKRPRLQRSSSTSVLTATPPQFTVLSPITLATVGQPLTVAGLPVATLAQLPIGSQLLPQYTTTTTTTNSGSKGKAENIALHPGSGLTLLNSSIGIGAGSSVEVLHLSQEAGEGVRDGEEQEDRPGEEKFLVVQVGMEPSTAMAEEPAETEQNGDVICLGMRQLVAQMY
ncbi:glucocorticoid modulatory element-binding protein 1-like [Chanos chanos]|uniref:Glucocorticoid modulatory element-binding protein 1-like n=1 Tax=Chanos chanos TaxID=29144 RepID=A0A6J2W6N5_CHACN|nr:glucocorticoid modulatory element-binding protein 1 [Chanos chanos]